MATFEITLVISSTAQISKLAQRVADPSSLLKKIGLTLLRESSAAFDLQRFGDVPWLVRYPNQSDPMVSYAGAVADLEKGPNIKSRRFERRPVLVDTNTLRRSLSPASGLLGASKYWVEVGTNLPYGEVNHKGEVTTQQVTPTIKKNLGLWLKKIAAKAKREQKAGAITPKTHQQFTASQKLVFLFHVDQLETHHVRRPFVGITPNADRDIQSLITDFFRKGVA